MNNILDEKSVIKITVKMAIIIIGIVAAIFSTIFTWQQVEISKQNIEITKLRDIINEKGSEIYILRTEDLPELEKKDVILETQQIMILKLIDGDLIIRTSNEHVPESPNE